MSNKDYEEDKFPFKAEISHRFSKWTGIKRDEDIDEALLDLTGDTYLEMRKLISMSLAHVESLIMNSDGSYTGFNHGKELTAEQKKGIKQGRDDLKEFLRLTIEATWRAILNKQKVGIDKLSIALKSYIKTDGDNN
jgi:hypothetical protein